MEQKTSLVKLEELYEDKNMAVRHNELNQLLNSDPKPEWIQNHPHISNYKYLTIQRVEWLLTMIFQRWRLEVKEVKQLANSVVVVVRLEVFNPISQTWDHQDGVGASPLQVDKGSSPIDWSKIKTSAVQMGAPSAEAYAMKDAAEKFGKIFGKDLNRKDLIAYTVLKNQFKQEEKAEGLEEDLQKMDGAKTMGELEDIFRNSRHKASAQFVEKFKSLKNKLQS